MKLHRHLLMAAVVLSIFVASAIFAWSAFAPAPNRRPAGERTITIPSPPSVPKLSVGATIRVGPHDQVVSVIYAAGSVWVSGYDDRGDYVLRVDSHTNEVVARIPAAISTCSVGGCGITFGAGAIWTTGVGLAPGGGRDAVLQRIDPTTNEVTQTVDLDGISASDVAVDSNGVWVSVFHDLRAPTEVVRVDPGKTLWIPCHPVRSSCGTNAARAHRASRSAVQAPNDTSGPTSVANQTAPSTTR